MAGPLYHGLGGLEDTWVGDVAQVPHPEDPGDLWLSPLGP